MAIFNFLQNPVLNFALLMVYHVQVISWMDYCNMLYMELPGSIQKLQLVHKAPAKWVELLESEVGDI